MADRKPIRLEVDDRPIVPPPASMTVDHEFKPVLYTADGKPLVRKAGY